MKYLISQFDIQNREIKFREIFFRENLFPAVISSLKVL